MPYIDCHTHAHFAAFKEDYREVIERALQNDVWVINVGTQKDTSIRGIEVAHEFGRGVFATVGLHPVHTSASFHDSQELGADPSTDPGFTSRGEEFDFDTYKKLAEDPKVVAIGECGLDYYRLEENTKKLQAEAFLGQVEVAFAVGKPLMIHCRQAFPDLITLLKEHKTKLRPTDPGVIHFFSGTVEEAGELAGLGFSFTFGGAITFPPKKGKEAGDYDEAIQFLPRDRILSETDAPYVTPVPYRGTRNEPVYVIEVVKRLAELKGVSEEEMKESIFTNAQRVFDLD